MYSGKWPVRAPDYYVTQLFHDVEFTGRYLDLMRKQAGFTQREMYEHLNISRSGLYRYMTNGASKIKLDVLMGLLDMCDYELVAVPKESSKARHRPKLVCEEISDARPEVDADSTGRGGCEGGCGQVPQHPDHKVPRRHDTARD